MTQTLEETKSRTPSSRTSMESLPDPRPRVLSVRVKEPGILTVTFDDGTTGDDDIRPLIARGGVFAHLASAEMFARVRVGENGRTLDWPAPDGTWDNPLMVDMCADALWLRLQGL